jgi:hypothetical protein
MEVMIEIGGFRVWLVSAGIARKAYRRRKLLQRVHKVKSSHGGDD